MNTRNLIVLFSWSIAFYPANSAVAQLSIRPVIGYNVTAILNANERDEDLYDFKNHLYPSFGLMVDIGGDGAQFSTGLGFTQYGRTLEFISPQEGPIEDCMINGHLYHCDVSVSGNARKTSSLQYLTLPLLLKYRSKSPGIKFYVAGGFQVAYLLHAEFISTADYTKTYTAAGEMATADITYNVSETYREELRTIHLSAVGDAGIYIPLSYQHAITIGPHLEYGVMDAFQEQMDYYDFWNRYQAYLPYKTFSIGLTAGMIFSVKRKHTRIQ